MTIMEPLRIDLTCGDRLNPFLPLSISARRDSDLPPEWRAGPTNATFKKKMKAERVEVPVAQYQTASHWCDLVRLRKQPHLQSSLINYQVKSPEEYDRNVEYDIDDEDDVWLEEENRKRAAAKEQPLSAEVFEKVLDRLEKETHFQTQRAPAVAMAADEEDNDDVCCVCGDGEVSNVNQIIYCDMCNIPVHQECYGVPYIPEGQWLCRKCKLSPSEPVSCELCPLQNGAFKPTADNKWAHVICAIWLNEVHFSNTVFLEPVEGVGNALRRRAKLRCLVCKVKGGACLQCSSRSCTRSFHVTCAAHAGLSMITEMEPTVKRFVYCHVHGQKALGEGEFKKSQKKAVEAIRRARASVVANRSSAPAVSIPLISPEARARIEEAVGVAVHDIMLYWYYKRRLRCGVPLIRRLQACTRGAARAVSFLETSKTELAVQKGRAAGERSRLLCELVKKRERDKFSHIHFSRTLFDEILKPVELRFEEIIDAVRKEDRHKVFTQRVERIEGYDRIITNPMDLSLMSQKAQRNEYSTLEDLHADFSLIFDNCDEFNKGNDFYFKYGKKMRKVANLELKKAQEFFQERESDDILSGVQRVTFYEEAEENKKSEVNITKTPKESRKRKKDPEGEREEQKEEVVEKKAKREKGERQETAEKAERVGGGGPTPAKRTRNESTQNHRNYKGSSRVAAAAPFTACAVLGDRQLRLGAEGMGGRARRSLEAVTAASAAASLPALSSTAYRDNCAILSPLGPDPVSCESSADEDESSTHPLNSFSASLTDIHALHHGDLVKVETGSRNVAGMVLERSLCAVDPNLLEFVKTFPPTTNGKYCIRLLTGGTNKLSCYDRSAVSLLNVSRDKCDGIEEARRIHMKYVVTK